MIGEAVEDENFLAVVAATAGFWLLRTPAWCRWRPGRGWTKIGLVGVGFEVDFLVYLVVVDKVVSKVSCLDDFLGRAYFSAPFFFGALFSGALLF